MHGGVLASYRWIGAASIAAAFYGDVYLGFTVPVCLPLLLFLATFGLLDPRRIPIGLFFIAALAIPIILQTATGIPPRGKNDLVVHLPILYAVLSILAFQSAPISDQLLSKALITGGLVTALTMILMAVFAPPNTYLIPGHAHFENYQKDIAKGLEFPAPPSAQVQVQAPLPPRDASPAVTPVQPTPPPAISQYEGATVEASRSEQEFYSFKNKFRNALGTSNYIAVFYVFLAIVGSFGGWIWLIFAGLALVTLSRLALIFLSLGIALNLLWKFKIVRSPVIVVAILVASAILLAFGFWSFAKYGNAPSSVIERVLHWETGIRGVLYSPLFGSPRSYVAAHLNISIVTHPHNVVFFLGQYYGLIGILLYAAYVLVAMRAIYACSQTSRLWTGIFYAFLILITWSFFEPISLTPAYEILLGCFYAQAALRQREPSVQLAHQIA